MTNTIQPPLLRDDAPMAKPSPRVPPGVQYHRVYAGEKRKILRGILAIFLLFAGMIGFAQLFLIGAAIIDTQVLGRTGFTPLQQAAGALSLGLLIPYSMLLQRVLYGVPASSLHSVTGKFRWAIFGRSLVAFGPLLVILISVVFLVPGETITWTTADLVALFVTGMLLTPLAAAGEEYGLRGLMFRVVGGWTRGALAGAILGIVATTVLFSLFHGTTDPYLLSTYLILFSSMAIITWRTGGLEVAVVVHAVYNVTALVLATTLHLDLGGALSTRADAVGSIESLVPSAGIVIITAIVWWVTRKTGPIRTPGE